MRLETHAVDGNALVEPRLDHVEHGGGLGVDRVGVVVVVVELGLEAERLLDCVGGLEGSREVLRAGFGVPEGLAVLGIVAHDLVGDIPCVAGVSEVRHDLGNVVGQSLEKVVLAEVLDPCWGLRVLQTR
ncbi:unnamed protein product [Phytophthora lilii]|uniref:Unnamed protein product n=1 Tax=Phytophthora lilii TaxID=2077276 RepID=A0A9W6XS20_9STRA|nr:unnamed protein product [Phytophthora lilii]